MPPLNSRREDYFLLCLYQYKYNYVVGLPPVRFLALSEHLVEVEHFSGKSGT